MLGPRPPTVIGNSPKFSSPSLLPRFFPSWTTQRMSCSCVSGPPRTKSPFFVIEVGAHHIYDDTGFFHNYRHRSVISMTGKKFVRPKISRMCLFFVVVLTRLYRCAGCVPDPVLPSCYAKKWFCLFQMISPEELRVKVRVA